MTDTRPPLTAHQIEVLAFIVDFASSHGGLGPLGREIAERFGVTRQGADDLIRRLIARGLVARKPRISRSLYVTEAGRFLGAGPGGIPHPSDVGSSDLASKASS
jgi:DNA-binding MarR family transcriptional regulator